jgi:hypothetical protein
VAGLFDRPGMAECTVMEMLEFAKTGSSPTMDQYRRDLFWWRVRMTLLSVASWVVLGIFAVGFGIVVKWVPGLSRTT